MKNSKKTEANDSGSDWDSMPEAHPSLKSEKEEGIQLKEESDENESSVSRSQRPKGKKHNENPPYSFKSEVRSPVRTAEEERPGKASKGQTYEPLYKNGNTKKYPSFPDEHVTSDTDEDHIVQHSKYTSSKPNSRKILLSPLNHNQSRKSPPGSNKPNGGVLVSSKMKMKSHPEEDGIRNEGYETDEEILFDKSPVVVNGVVIGTADYQVEGFPIDSNGNLKTERKRSLIQVAETDATIEIFSHSSLQKVNKNLEKGFHYAALPLVCFFLFFHHLLRFFILHLAKPLLLDTVAICSAYFIRPLFANVLHPLFQNIQLATMSMGQIFINVMKPLIVLLKSCRLVEVNYKDRNRLPQV